MAQDIVGQFPIVSRADLVYGDRCGICRETYSTNIPGSGIVAEDAVRLPCGHEFGSDCISTWLSPGEGQNTCPLCRSQLFPAAAPAVEDGRGPAPEVWDGMAIELDSELRAQGIVHRSRPFRDWLLYSQLQGQGANLPHWRPSSTDPGPRLNAEQEEALFGELQRRGAFNLLPVPVGPLVPARAIWDFLRDYGFSFDPIYAATAGGCAWSRA